MLLKTLLTLFVRAEELVRQGRLRGLQDADIAEHLVLSL